MKKADKKKAQQDSGRLLKTTKEKEFEPQEIPWDGDETSIIIVGGVRPRPRNTAKSKAKAHTLKKARGKKTQPNSVMVLKATKEKEFEPQEAPWEGDETSFGIVGGVRPPVYGPFDN